MGRVRQFVAHLSARVDAAEEARAVALLPPGARRLFSEMPTADRRHALDVAAVLISDGHADHDLLAAALLHDAAKGRRMRLPYRVAGVVLEALAPSVLRRLARADRRSVRYPFHLYLHHAELSADQALAAGCSPRAAAFIWGEAPPPDAGLLEALRRADDAA